MAKNALLTLTDLWRGLGDALDPELTMVCPILIKKLADKVEFLADAAREVHRWWKGSTARSVAKGWGKFEKLGATCAQGQRREFSMQS